MKLRLTIFLCLSLFVLLAQEQPGQKKQMPDYYRKEEIIHYGKLYRIHNNYLSFGPAFISSSIRANSQRGLGVDYNFHIKEQYFQVGGLMSGESIGSNNHLQAHLGYGYRKETKTSNLAFYAGPTYYSGVIAVPDSVYGTLPLFYRGFGFYACAQAIYKLSYDIGFGAELLAEFSERQNMFGFKITAFFSGAYVGKKKNYNPNVRSENQR